MIIKYSKRIVGVKPPKFKLYNLASNLREKPNNKIIWLAQKTGFITTIFKRLGIFGWIDLKIDIIARGRIVFLCTSSDKLMTIDIKIYSMTANGIQQNNTNNKYIRIEVKAPHRIKNMLLIGEKIIVEGNLAWDGDGHFEIHPVSINMISTFKI